MTPPNRSAAAPPRRAVGRSRRRSLSWSLGRLAHSNMTSANRKLGWIAIIALLSLCGALLWSTWPSQPLRVSFLHLTNDVHTELDGVFRLDNGSKETVSAIGFIHEKQTARGCVRHIGDFGADLGGAKLISPGTSATFRVWVPTNGGPYRLVLDCVPQGGAPNRVKRWVVDLLLQLRLPLRQRFIDRFVNGHSFPTSQPFRLEPPNQSLETNPR